MEQYGANAATYSTYQETCWMASDFGADCSDVKTDVSLGRPPINKPNFGDHYCWVPNHFCIAMLGLMLLHHSVLPFGQNIHVKKKINGLSY